VGRVYCIEWSDEDEQGPRRAGWSLHLSRNDAEAYGRKRAAQYDWHSPPFCVEVPDDVLEALTGSRRDLFWASPTECPFPVVRERPAAVASEPVKDLRTTV